MDDVGDVRGNHVRHMLNNLTEQKNAEQKKIKTCERNQNHMTYALTALLSMQGIINITQSSSLLEGMSMTIQVLACVATIITVLTTGLGKHMLDGKTALAASRKRLQKWEKAEDGFILELALILEDGELTAAEHQRLIKRFSEARDAVDSQTSKIIPTYSYDDPIVASTHSLNAPGPVVQVQELQALDTLPKFTTSQNGGGNLHSSGS